MTLNTTQDSPKLFGEYTFLREFLFTASCISDRGIVPDINGDTGFIDLTGLRSFNSILQTENEGRNTPFSKDVSSLFFGIIQSGNTVAAAKFDDYAFFAVNTVYGYVLIVYDTINNIYASVDIKQGDTDVGIKQLVNISTEQTALFGLTVDDKVVQLYKGPSTDEATVRFMSVCSQNPKIELKQSMFRCVINEITQNSEVTLATFVNNRISGNPQTKEITYVAPNPVYSQNPYFSDANTQINNLLFTQPNMGQGWKSWNVLSWTGGGKITNVLTVADAITPMNPLLTQSNTK